MAFASRVVGVVEEATETASKCSHIIAANCVLGLIMIKWNEKGRVLVEAFSHQQLLTTTCFHQTSCAI